MSDECLMKQEFGFPFYIVYQAVMRKFTLADIPLAGSLLQQIVIEFNDSISKCEAFRLN